MSIPTIALIGISGYGRIHLQLARACRDRGELRIAAVTVINPDEERENLAELTAHGTAIYGDFREMLRKEAGRIDLCLIPTGIHWHARMTIAALAAGANVLVEKPLAGGLDEVAAIQRAEREAQRFVAVGFQDLYDPGTIWLKQHLLSGTIGALRSVKFLGIWPRLRSYFTRNEWAGRATVEGVAVADSPLNNAFAHFVLLSQYFASDSAREVALPQLTDVELWRAHAIENFDTAVVRARTTGGVKLWFGVSHACRESVEPEIVVEGEQGTAGWRYEKEAFVRNGSLLQFRRPNGGADQARREMMTAVLARLRDPSMPICGTEMAARHTELIAAIQRAGPVRSFPASAVHWASDGTSEFADVEGLGPALRGAFERQDTLGAHGFH